MADLLKRSLAPVTDQAWAEIDAEAARTLRNNLSARALVDMTGPSGAETAAVNLGRTETLGASAVDGVDCALRQVLPLLEARTSFRLSLSDLDDISRGAKTPELGPVVQAARKCALFEESALYHGIQDAGIEGICGAATLDAVPMATSAGDFVEMTQDALGRLREAAIGGPYAMVLGDAPFRAIKAGDQKGYPLLRRIEELLGGSVHWSPALEKGVVLSQRGGDYEMTVGQDLSIGFAGQNGDTLNLFVVESFTFQVLEPAAAVVLG